MLITKLADTSIKRLPSLFLVSELDDLDHVVRVYQKARANALKAKSSGVVLTSISANWFIQQHVEQMGYTVIPNAIFLLVKRISPTNPLDFDLFKNDVALWSKKLCASGKRFMSLFIYDPVHIPHIMIKYLPVVLIDEQIDGALDINTCLTASVCVTHAIPYQDSYIVLGIWSYNKKIGSGMTLPNIDYDHVVEFCNPFFCSNPLNLKNNYDNNKLELKLDELWLTTFNPSSVLGKKDVQKLIIEFFSSYISKLKKLTDNITYLWLPVPSSYLLPIVYTLISNINTKKLLVVSPINNFSEKGSTNNDRIWLGILKYLSKAKLVKTIISSLS